LQGVLLDFSIQSNTGEISGDDGNRYTFSGDHWLDSGTPVSGTKVDFVGGEDSTALKIYRAQTGSVARPLENSGTKSRVAAGVLAILLGGLGVHKFYLGYHGIGVLYLLIGTVGWILFFPPIVLGVVALVEGIVYLTKSDEEFENTYVLNQRKLF